MLLIRFIAGSRVVVESEVASALPIVANGPPGTVVLFSDGYGVRLPTDQIVVASDEGGSAHVGFGGMSFRCAEEDRLIFDRVRDLRPVEELSPERGRVMILEARVVDSVEENGAHLWPLHA